jgi:hypothetical protein
LSRRCRQHRKPNGFSAVTGAKSRQHAGAMHLDRSHADSEIVGDHLVRAAGADRIENLPLARAERSNPLGRCCFFSIPSRPFRHNACSIAPRRRSSSHGLQTGRCLEETERGLVHG